MVLDVHAFIESFINALEAKDAYTAGHSERVSEYAVDLAKRIGLPEWEVETIHIAAHLHDIGKLGIPDGLLLKSGSLSSAEYLVVQSHAQKGYEILANVKGFEDVAKIVRHHHEHYDGNGYPDGLAGTDIPLGARLIAIADAFDAMTSNQTYHPQLSRNDALQQIRECSGFQFDPLFAEVFCWMLSESLTPTGS